MILCSIVTFLFLCVPVHAQGTEIYTVVPEDVPEKHTMTIQIASGGAVMDEAGATHTSSYTIDVFDGASFALTLVPDTNYEVDQVKLNGQVLSITNNKVEIAKVLQDSTIAITWKKATPVDPEEPEKEVYTIIGTITENGKPASDIYLELHSEPKTFITGNDGTFRFENVEPGNHTLTAYRNQKQVGFLAFKLSKEGVGINIEKLPDGTFQLNVDQNVTTLELDIALEQNGTMSITNATSVPETPTEPTDPTDPSEPSQQPTTDNPPDTGDSTSRTIWLSLLLLSACGIVVLGYRKYKHQNQ